MIEATEVFLKTAGSVGYPLSTYRYSGNAIFLGLGDVELKSHTVYYGFPWKPTFERRLIFGCAFEGFLRFSITLEVPTTVLWGRRKSLPAVWCHWLTVAVIYF